MSRFPAVDSENAALLTDLYELTMLQAYWHEGMQGEAVFSLFVRRLPEERNYLLACGLDDALTYLEHLHFGPAALDFLAGRDEFTDDFIRWLADLRFTGDVYAVAEGTPVFPDEPILEVVAPIGQAQIAESFIMNQVHCQTVLASKAARVVTAAAGRTVVDFGMRRMHGTDAALKAARAFHVAGVSATSNVLAGQIYGIPISGTMAHSYVQAHSSEREAFRAFADLYPETVLLVDSYDTLAGVREVAALAHELGEHFRIRAIRLDSGDLAQLAVEARRILDHAGLDEVGIFASGGLDEYAIGEIVKQQAPINGFGVGTGMGVSQDAPALDAAYKLTAYDGEGRLKLSTGKRILPGRKQIFRVTRGGTATHDILARSSEQHAGRPLLQKVFAGGRRLPAGRTPLAAARRHATEEVAALPPGIRAVEPAADSYRVEISRELEKYQEQVAARVARRQ